MYSYIAENNFGPPNQIIVPTDYTFIGNLLGTFRGILLKTGQHCLE